MTAMMQKNAELNDIQLPSYEKNKEVDQSYIMVMVVTETCMQTQKPNFDATKMHM